jgi:hypothetical protein
LAVSGFAYDFKGQVSGARSEAMAGASCASGGLLAETGNNASALVRLKNNAVSLSYRRGLLESNNILLSAGIPVNLAGDIKSAAGISLYYAGYGQISNEGAVDAPVDASEFTLIAGYGIEFVKDISAGISARMNSSSMGSKNDFEPDIEVSAGYNHKDGMSAAIVISRIVFKPGITAGFNYPIGTQEHKVFLEADGSYISDYPVKAAAGFEYAYKEFVFARAGYMFESSSVNGLTAGAGVKINVKPYDIKIDYAISPKTFFVNDMEYNHTVTMEFGF